MGSSGMVRSRPTYAIRSLSSLLNSLSLLLPPAFRQALPSRRLLTAPHRHTTVLEAEIELLFTSLRRQSPSTECRGPGLVRRPFHTRTVALLRGPKYTHQPDLGTMPTSEAGHDRSYLNFMNGEGRMGDFPPKNIWLPLPKPGVSEIQTSKTNRCPLQ